MNTNYSVTYNIVTPESAEYGDYDETGFIDEKLSLRDAVDELFSTRTCEVDGIEGIEADCGNYRQTRCITVINSEEFDTVACESRSLHIPDSITPSSRARLVRLLTK